MDARRSFRARVRAIVARSALILVLAQVATGLRAADGSGYLPLWSAKPGHIADLVLIYQGGAKRLKWTEDQLAPYVTWNKDRERWLFDGFLFIEFSDGRGHDFAAGYSPLPAGKKEWTELLDQNFAPSVAIAALDSCVGKAIGRLGSPPVKRKVVLTLPEPIRTQTNWGILSGQQINFQRPQDRLSACEWHMDEALSRWRKLGPKHIELGGFYWVAEQSSHSVELLPSISKAAHARGLCLYWIPYWNAAGAKQWRELGFDYAWQQPNHFFHPDKVGDERLAQAAAFARERGMGLEFEADARAISSPDRFRPRFYKYLKAYEHQGAHEEASMAYYEGGGALLQMAQSKDPDVYAMYEALAKWVSERQFLMHGKAP